MMDFIVENATTTGQYTYPVKGTFTWAVDMMKQGKKVRRKGYLGNGNGVMKIHRKGTLTKTKILNEGCNIYWSPTVDDIDATDWEIVLTEGTPEELKKTLWDKKEVLTGDNNNGRTTDVVYTEGDVSEALKDVKLRLKTEMALTPYNASVIDAVFEEELGKELIE